MVCLHVDHPDAEGDTVVHFGEGFEVFARTVGKLEDDMVGSKGIEESKQGFPSSALNRLTAIVAEAEVDGFSPFEGIKNTVDGLGGKGTMGGVPGNVCLVHLQAGAR